MAASQLLPRSTPLNPPNSESPHQPDVQPYIIYRVLAGSQAFGLAQAGSDEDRRGVYLPPADWHWSLNKPPEQVEWRSDGVEEVNWELEKFLTLALKANPNILETLWAPVVLQAEPIGQELRALRRAFLSRRLHSTYSHYARSQLRLIEQRLHRTGAYKPKHAMHLIRLLHSGIHAVQYGEILVEMGEHRDELLAIRRGEWSFPQLQERMTELAARFDELLPGSPLPDQPDTARVNAFLIQARRKRAEER